MCFNNGWKGGRREKQQESFQHNNYRGKYVKQASKCKQMGKYALSQHGSKYDSSRYCSLGNNAQQLIFWPCENFNIWLSVKCPMSTEVFIGTDTKYSIIFKDKKFENTCSYKLVHFVQVPNSPIVVIFHSMYVSCKGLLYFSVYKTIYSLSKSI